MRLKKIIHSNEGVVGIVVAILLLGLLFSIISLIQYKYVPEWMKEKEAEHMNDVLVQFSEMKFAVDTQIGNNQTNTPISTSITLGSERMQYFMSLPSAGILETKKNAFNIKINYYNATLTEKEEKIIGIGVIRYRSENYYYIPDEKQSYIYEAGAIIINQTKGNSISTKPSLKITKDSDLEIFFNIVNITPEAEKESIYGSDTQPIHTEYNGTSIDESLNNIKSIEITSSYTNSWFETFNSTLKKAGYHNNTDYTINIIGNKINITFDPDDIFQDAALSNLPDLELKVEDVLTQIGPGRVD